MPSTANPTDSKRTEKSGKDPRIRYVRAIINIPPLFFVLGLVFFWLAIMAFGQGFQIRIDVGDPKDSMPGLLMWFGYIFLLGTFINLSVYSLVWPFLSIFKRELFPGARYAWSVFISSFASILLLWPAINWFLD